MTNDKINEVLDLYERKLSELCRLPLHAYPIEVRHLATMINKTRTFVAEGQIGEAFRWLGFMQGAFWVMGTYKIDEMRGHNAPAGEG